MPNRRLKVFWGQMPVGYKINAIGSFLMITSLFFPWYSDVDSFRTGDVYIGLTGPTYFAGFTFLFISLLSFGISIVKSMKFKFQKPAIFKRDFTILQLSGGIFAFYLLFLVNTVYFHPQFGLNIISKETGLGNLLGFFAASFMTIGGFLAWRKIKTTSEKFQKSNYNEVDLSIVEETRSAIETLRKQGNLQQRTKITANSTPPSPKIPAYSNEEKVSHPEKTPQTYRMDL